MIIIGGTYPPFRFAHDDGRMDGIEVMIMEELLKPLGAVPKFVVVPFKRGLAMLAAGQADAMIGLVRSPEREQYLHYVEPPYVSDSRKAFYVAKGRANTITSYDDLYKLSSIGVSSGVKYFAPFDDDPKLKKDESNNSSTCLRKLVHERIDTAIITEIVGDYLIQVFHLRDKLEKAPFVVTKQAPPSYLCLSQKSPWMAREKDLAERMRQMVTEGRVKAIIKEFFAKLTQQTNP